MKKLTTDFVQTVSWKHIEEAWGKREFKKFPKLIGAVHLVALLGSGKYKVSKPTKAEYFANVKFWDKDDEKLRGDFQVFIKLTPPRDNINK